MCLITTGESWQVNKKKSRSVVSCQSLAKRLGRTRTHHGHNCVNKQRKMTGTSVHRKRKPGKTNTHNSLMPACLSGVHLCASQSVFVCLCVYLSVRRSTHHKHVQCLQVITTLHSIQYRGTEPTFPFSSLLGSLQSKADKIEKRKAD